MIQNEVEFFPDGNDISCNQTCKWIGITGIDCEFKKLFTLDELSAANQVLIDYWNNGGLITIIFSPHNPWINHWQWENME